MQPSYRKSPEVTQRVTASLPHERKSRCTQARMTGNGETGDFQRAGARLTGIYLLWPDMLVSDPAMSNGGK